MSIEIDKQIAAAVRDGDPVALNLIWDAYGARVFGFLLSILLCRQDAEDAMQNLFLKIARNRDRLGKASNVKAYLFAMARNEAVDFMRRRPKNTESLDAQDLDFLTAPDSSAVDGAETERVERALAALPDDQRQVVFLKIWQDMTFQEIGEALTISQNTAASRYRYAMQKMREIIGPKQCA